MHRLGASPVILVLSEVRLDRGLGFLVILKMLTAGRASAVRKRILHNAVGEIVDGRDQSIEFPMTIFVHRPVRVEGRIERNH